MTKGFPLHINSTTEDFKEQIGKIFLENHKSFKGIDEIEIALHDDSDLKTGINKTTGEPFQYVGGGKAMELATFDIGAGTKFVFIGRPELEKYVYKFGGE